MCPTKTPTSKQRGTDEHENVQLGLFTPYVYFSKKIDSAYGREKEKEAKEGTRLKFLPNQDASDAANPGNRAAQVRPAAAAHVRARHVQVAVEALRF